MITFYRDFFPSVYSARARRCLRPDWRRRERGVVLILVREDMNFHFLSLFHKSRKKKKNELQNILAVTELEFPLDNKKHLDCDIQKLIYLKHRSRTKKNNFRAVSFRLFASVPVQFFCCLLTLHACVFSSRKRILSSRRIFFPLSRFYNPEFKRTKSLRTRNNLKYFASLNRCALPVISSFMKYL